LIAVAIAAWYASSRRAPAPEPVAVAPAAPAPPAPPARPQPEQEVVFWESVRNSTNPAELSAYLARYPEGAFAALARARLDALAAAAAKPAAPPPAKVAVAPPAPERKPAEKPAAAEPRAAAKADQEALIWESVRGSNDPTELKAYLARYPEGAFAPLARARLDSIAAAEAKRAAEPRLNLPQAAAARPETLRLPAQEAAGAARFDGRWAAQLACDAFMELQAFKRDYSTEIRDGNIQLSAGTPGQPGYWRVQGKVGEGDRLTLAGTVIAASQAYRGQENSARFDGRFGTGGYEGAGGFGKRRCTLTMTRAGT
jgi:hypothetical protein